jgi:hypothetical protein
MSDAQKREYILPRNAGYLLRKPTLCIGLDFAWFGGSANDQTSQYDFLAAILIDSPKGNSALSCTRVKLIDRDSDGSLTARAIDALVETFKADRIVLAIDAPLQTINRELPPRTPKPEKGTVQRRAVDSYLSECRKRIDKRAGGSSGWHPNIQPGAPLPKRLTSLLSKVNESHNFQAWTTDLSETTRLAIECFPAEAIWAAKRLDQFPQQVTASNVRSYKEQAGNQLSSTQVRHLVETTLLEGFKWPSGVPTIWPRLVEDGIKWMLEDVSWQKSGFYRGGKMLDDVVDSLICLATAISYATNNAHVWCDPKDSNDGHIIGPGRFTGSP